MDNIERRFLHLGQCFDALGIAFESLKGELEKQNPKPKPRKYKAGCQFKSPCGLMCLLACVGNGEYVIVTLETGNRFTRPKLYGYQCSGLTGEQITSLFGENSDWVFMEGCYNG